MYNENFESDRGKAMGFDFKKGFKAVSYTHLAPVMHATSRLSQTGCITAAAI